MRIRECSSPPSLVVEWLCSQLERRNVPAPSIHANILLSLLHSYYCSNTSDCLQEKDSRLSVQDQVLDLLDFHSQLVHPDADVAPVSAGLTDAVKESSSVTENKRCLGVHKSEAVQCLVTACKQNQQDVESLIEELCQLLLKSIQDTSSLPVDKLSSSLPLFSTALQDKIKKRSSNSVTIHSKHGIRPVSSILIASLNEAKTREQVINFQQDTNGPSSNGSNTYQVTDPTSDTYIDASLPLQSDACIKSGSPNPGNHNEVILPKQESGNGFLTDVLKGTTNGSELRTDAACDSTPNYMDCFELVQQMSDILNMENNVPAIRSSPQTFASFIPKIVQNTERADQILENKFYEYQQSMENQLNNFNNAQTSKLSPMWKSGLNQGDPNRQFNMAVQHHLAPSIWSTSRNGPEDSADGGYFGDISSRESSEDRQGKQCAGPETKVEFCHQIPNRTVQSYHPDEIFDKLSIKAVTKTTSENSSPTQRQADMAACLNSFADIPTSNIFRTNDSFFSTEPVDAVYNNSSRIQDRFHNSFQNSSELQNHGNDAPQNIWSDVNDNKVINPVMGLKEIMNRINSSEMSLTDKEDENKLCRNFQSLGLQRFWTDSVVDSECGEPSAGIDVVDKNVWGGESTLKLDQESQHTCHNPQQYAAPYDRVRTEMYAEPNMQLPPVGDARDSRNALFTSEQSCGPVGAQAVIQHRYMSNFSNVVPKRFSGNEMSKVPGSRVLPSSTSENLLTSPRTHFRPITLQEDAQGTAAVTTTANSPVPCLTYQRSHSGSLYLERDVMEGSPKKYMVYKEPIDKIGNASFEVGMKDIQGAPLVPKFKVVKNEKFCQTDEQVASPFDEGVKETECDVFAFQDSDINLNMSGNGNIEANATGCNFGITDIQPPYENNNMFSSVNEFGVTAYGNNKRNSGDSENGVFCMRAGAPTFYSNVPEEKGKTSRILDTPAANAIWSTDPGVEDANSSAQYKQVMRREGLNSAIKALWNNSPQEKRNVELRDLDSLSESVDDNSGPGWSMVRSNLDNDLSGIIPQEWAKEESISCAAHSLQSEEVSIEGIIIRIPGTIDTNGRRVWSTGDDVRPLDGGAQWSEAALWYSLPQVEAKRPGGDSSDLADLLEAQKWEEMVSMGDTSDEPRTQPSAAHHQEDLEELDPGWTLQEGFVWGDPQNENPHVAVAEDLNLHTDDDCESLSSNTNSDVLMVATEDGNTLAVPVEYLETDMYDQLFGNYDDQVSSSLPDLPNSEETIKMMRERWLPAWRRPCTFFMEGTCRRKHCKFSHDLSSITCRFWEEGTCLKGEECPFLHGYPAVVRRRNHSEGDSRLGLEERPAKSGEHHKGGHKNHRASSASASSKFRHRHSSFEIASEADFPSLGGSNSDILKDCPKKEEAPALTQKRPTMSESIPVNQTSKTNSQPSVITQNLSKSLSTNPKPRSRRNTRSPPPSFSTHKTKHPNAASKQEKPAAKTCGSKIPSSSELNNNGGNNNKSIIGKRKKAKKYTIERKKDNDKKPGEKGKGNGKVGKATVTRSSVHHDGTVSDY